MLHYVWRHNYHNKERQFKQSHFKIDADLIFALSQKRENLIFRTVLELGRTPGVPLAALAQRAQLARSLRSARHSAVVFTRISAVTITR